MRLVARTGWGREDDKRRALEAGFDQHLTKPLDPNELNSFLDRLLECLCLRVNCSGPGHCLAGDILDNVA